MALNYKLSTIIGHDTLCWKPAEVGKPAELNPITAALINMTMNLGMPKITKGNAEQFYQRYATYKALYGGKDTPITLPDIRQHVGLATNAEPYSDTRFKEVMWAGLVRYAESRLKNELDIEKKAQGAIDFLLNSLEHMTSTKEAIEELSKALGFESTHPLGERIMSEWDALPADIRIKMGRPEVHAITVRKWVTAIIRG